MGVTRQRLETRIASRRAVTRGQSLVEFTLILPIMLTLLGAVLDVARVYQGWITLESATRDGAEYAATNATSSAAALSEAGAIICTQAAGLPGYAGAPGNPASCTQPAVTIVAFSQSATAPGASATYPIGTVTVRATLPFQTLFPYPLFTHDGAWTLSSTRTYAIVQGRQ